MNITETLRNAGELALKYREMDLYEQIVSLREEIASLRESNLSLRDENKSLRETLEVSHQIVRHGNCYFKTSDTNHEHPYCLACWDHERKLVSMIRGYDQIRGVETVHCNICDAR